MRIHVTLVACFFTVLLLTMGELLARKAGYPDHIEPMTFVEGVGHTLDPVTVFDTDTYDSECKVLLIGDSILSGLRTDMQTLMDSVVQRNADMRACQITNASIGGWSPNGILKWINRFGWLNADRVIFVFNSDDLDQPPVDQVRLMSATYDRHDRLASVAWFKNTILRRIDNRLHAEDRYPGAGKADMMRLLTEAENNVPRVEVLWHLRLRDSLSGETPPEDIALAAAEIRAPLIALKYSEEDYLDRIHLNERGKRKMIDQLAEILAGQGTTVHVQLSP